MSPIMGEQGVGPEQDGRPGGLSQQAVEPEVSTLRASIPDAGSWAARIDETHTIRDGGDNQVAIFTFMHTRTGGRRSVEQVALNTRLAAAAPDLFEACRDWIEWLDADDGSLSDVGADYEAQMLAAMRAALAKAGAA